MRKAVFIAALLFGGCGLAYDAEEFDTPTVSAEAEFIDLSKREKPEAIVTSGWNRVVIQTPDYADVARFWTEIGGYETIHKTETEWILGAPGTEDGFIAINQNVQPNAEPARPSDAKAWDTGCYWSIMMRAKKLETIIADAAELGWAPLTDMAYLEFGPSKLHIVVLTHLKTGTRIQLYERLTTALPEGFPDFERVSRPFNIMQMVENREVAYDFFQQVLGFETFYYGKPYVAQEPAVMPLGIPPELTTEIPYKAAILFPEKDMEWGRFEMIEIDGMPNGNDYSKICGLERRVKNVMGVVGVVYQVENTADVAAKLQERGAVLEHFVDDSSGTIAAVMVESPDGALIAFEEKG